MPEASIYACRAVISWNKEDEMNRRDRLVKARLTVTISYYFLHNESSHIFSWCVIKMLPLLYSLMAVGEA